MTNALSKARAGRPTAAMVQAREAELLDAALDAFLEHGYVHATIDAIAAATRMTKRTIYARHGDKAALFRAAVQRAIGRMKVAPETLAMLDDGDLRGTLTRLARLRIAQAMTPEGQRLQRVINTESARFPDIFAAYGEQIAGPAISFLAGLLRRHDSAGAVCVTQPVMAATVFMSMVVGGPVRMLAAGQSLSNDALEERVAFAVGLFLDGVRPRLGEGENAAGKSLS
jgi:TetR/AcrR family transcriptional regulator, mexJK operon transcriptional repressor